MARILALHSAKLPHTLTRDEIRESFTQWLSGEGVGAGRWKETLDRNGIESRGSILSRQEACDLPAFTQRNLLYRRARTEWGGAALRGALRAGPFQAERLHSLVSVSCTGVTIPSADVAIAASLGLSPFVRRIPMTELGCSGGAAALARAAELVDAHPGSTGCLGSLRRADLAALLSVELCTLSFQREDLSPQSIVASAIFGDAAVACILGTDDTPPLPSLRGPRIVGARSHVEPNTEHHLGFDLRSTGFHIVLARELPRLVRDAACRLVPDFLSDLGWALEDVQRWIIHPGSEKIIHLIVEGLGLGKEAARPSLDVLREHGNPSSAGILLGIARVQTEAVGGDRGLILAFGPGLSTELVALEW